MIPARFEYVAPTDVAACLDALRDGGRVLAGGTWVLPEMARNESRPSRLVDLRHAGLRTVEATADGVHLGAMSTYSDVLSSEQVRQQVPLLHLMASGITGGWALRNQATLGGSAAAARPQSDVPATLVAAGAEAVIAGPGAARRIPVAELFLGAMTNALGADEVLVGFDVPSAEGSGHGYVKLKRGASSWPIATAAATVRLDDSGACESVSLALGGVAAVPLPVDLSALLCGEVLTDDLLGEAARQAQAALVDPWGDVLAPAAYRRSVAAPVARRALTMARDNARTAGEDDRDG